MAAPDHFNSWADLLPEALLLVDASGVILAINQAGSVALREVDLHLGVSTLPSLCLDPEDQVLSYLHLASRTKSLVPGTLSFQSACGTRTAYRAEAALFAARDGTCAAQLLLRLRPKLAAEKRFLLLNEQVESLSREVDRRRRAELEVTAQREQFRVTLSSIGDGVIATDIKGAVTFMNPVASSHTGWDIQEAKGRPITEIFHIVNAGTRALVPNPVARVLAEGIIVGLANHTILVRKDGSEIHIDDSGAPIRDADGTLIGAVLVFHDITARRELEQQINVRTVALEDEHKRKDEFLAMLGHELRNPLAPIKSALQLYNMASVGEDGRRRAIEILGRQVDHLTRLVDELLDVTRVSTGKITLKKEVIEIASVFHRAIELCEPLIQNKKHQLTTDMPAEALYVKADLSRLTQVFGNLLHNAAKYTEPGGHILLEARKADHTIQVTVKDNGMGIHPAVLPHVFEAFTQSERALARSEGGLGVGLTLARRLVEQHGGHIEARSAGLDQGSQFVVVLPLAVVQAAPQNVTGMMAHVSAGRKILVVDDNRDAAEMLAEILKMSGNEVFVAFDGKDAIDIAARERPGIIFLDLGLPGLNGYAVAKELRLRHMPDKLHIVAVTGYGQEDDIRKTKTAGFDHHLVKPVNIAAIFKILSSSEPGNPASLAEQSGLPVG